MPSSFPKITSINRKSRFEKDLKSLKPDVLKVAKEAIEDLFQTPIPAKRRLHSLSGYKNPKFLRLMYFQINLTKYPLRLILA